jgi:TolB-like protein
MIKQFFAELRRRRVFRVAAVYGLVGWLLVQVAGSMEQGLGLPNWFDGFIITTLLIGFPVALVLAWAFDLTPEGVRRDTALQAERTAGEPEAAPAHTITPAAPAASRLPDKHSFTRPGLAVLPLQNMSSDAELEFLADGLTEDIITSLSYNQQLSVAARTSTFAYKGQSADIRAIGEALGVRYILEGSVRKMGEQARVTVQFIEAQTGAHIWARKFDEAIEALHRSCDDLVAKIAAGLYAQLMWAEAARSENAPAESLGAWEYCQRVATVISRSAGSMKAQRKTVAEMRKALEIEPDYGPAHALMSWVCNAALLNGTYDDEQLGEFVNLAKHHLRRARELAGDDLLCLTYIGGAENFAGMQERALHTLQKVLQRNPASSDAHMNICQVYAYLGRYDDARHAIDRAIELAPEAGFAQFHSWYQGLVEFLAGNYQLAAPAIERHTLSTPEYGLGNIMAALCMDALGNRDAAKKYVARAKEHNPQLRPDKASGMILFQFDKEKGRREYAALERLWIDEGGVGQ